MPDKGVAAPALTVFDRSPWQCCAVPLPFICAHSCSGRCRLQFYADVDDADVDDADDDDVVVQVVSPKMLVQETRPALHLRAVTSAVDVLQVIVAHGTNLASAALQDSEFVAEVALVEQGLVMVRRNMCKLQARLDSLSRQHVCQRSSANHTRRPGCRPAPLGPWEGGVGGAAGTN